MFVKERRHEGQPGLAWLGAEDQVSAALEKDKQIRRAAERPQTDHVTTTFAIFHKFKLFLVVFTTLCCHELKALGK